MVMCARPRHSQLLTQSLSMVLPLASSRASSLVCLVMWDTFELAALGVWAAK